jgi:hypothetical protein
VRNFSDIDELYDVSPKIKIFGRKITLKTNNVVEDGFYKEFDA